MTAQSLDEVQGWFTILRSYTEQRDKAQEFIDLARSKIEEALGENETGLLAGVPVVKWTHVTSNRFDQKKAKAFLTDEQAAQCINTVESRRFVLLDMSDQTCTENGTPMTETN
jgi:hypothetical protein